MPYDFKYSSRRPLPSDWQPRRATYPVSTYLQVEGLSIKYVGEGREDTQAASVRANHPLPKDIPLYYYELKVINAGQKGFIGMGFCREDSNLSRLPGWEAHTYGYHGDDGHSFNGPGRSNAYGPTYAAGDVVGALYDATQQTITFFKNGESLGVAFRGVNESSLYPMVGLRTPDEEVVVNFGASPFAVDVAELMRAAKQRILDSIFAVQLPLTAGAPAAACSIKAGQQPGQNSKTAQQQRPQPSPERRQQQQMAGLDDKEVAAMDVDPLPAAAEQDATAAAMLEDLLRPQPAEAGHSKGSGQPLLPLLVFEYLLHHRCWRTAEVVARELLSVGAGSSGSSSAAVQPPAAVAAAAASGSRIPGGISSEQQQQQQQLDTAAAEPDGDVAMTDSAAVGEAPADGNANGAIVSSSGASTQQQQQSMQPGSSAGSPTGAAAAAAASSSSSGCLSEAQVRDAVARQQVYDLVLAGRLDEAAAQIQQHCSPGFWEARPRLLFQLRLQQFVELLRSNSAPAEAVLLYGRQELGPLMSCSGDEEQLAEALSLLAYADPASSPCGHLLRPGQREQLAEQLNGAMLADRGAAPLPLLQQLYRQLMVVLEELRRQGSCAALCVDTQELLLAKKS